MNRAEEILRKHEQGYTYTALAKEYGITAQTCKVQCKKALERRELQVNEIYKALCYVNDDENRNVRTIHMLRRNGITSTEDFLNLSVKQLKKYRDCGPVTIAVIQQAQNYILSSSGEGNDGTLCAADIM